MNVERYREILEAFDLLLGVGKEVSARLMGTTPTRAHHSYADPIYTKLISHAISLRTLSPRLTTNFEAQQLWDMPSACAIARCIIEAHDVLEYIALCDLPEPERQFRELVWQLHDQERRLKMLQFIKSADPRALEIHDRVKQLMTQVVAHPEFQKIGTHLQKRIKQGDAPSSLLSQRDLNAANDVNHDYHTAATMMLSQYVHTLPMSVYQLFEFSAGTPEAIHMSSLPIQYSLGFVARALARMVETFPVADHDLTEKQAEVIFTWSSLVKTGVSAASREP